LNRFALSINSTACVAKMLEAEGKVSEGARFYFTLSDSGGKKTGFID
jgi:hypothetical protein